MPHKVDVLSCKILSKSLKNANVKMKVGITSAIN